MRGLKCKLQRSTCLMLCAGSLLSFNAAAQISVKQTPPMPANKAVVQTAQTPTVQPEAEINFDIQRYAISGVTLFKLEEIARELAPFIGKNKNFGDVQQAVDVVQNAYVVRGYSAVRVLLPEQTLASGVIQIAVTESRIGKVTVEGNKHFSDQNIRASLPALQPGSSPNTRIIAEQLRLANENPSRKTSVVLRATAQEDAVDLLANVSDEKFWEARVLLDNTGTAATGENRVGLGFMHANVLNRDHVFQLAYMTSPSKMADVTAIGAGYKIPLYAWGDSVEVIAGYADVNSGMVQDLFNISGTVLGLGARYNQNLSKWGEHYEHRFTYAVDYRAYDNNLTLEGDPVSLVPDVTAHPLSVSYSGRWQNKIGFQLSAAKNIPGGTEGDDAAFAASRAGAKADYQIFRYGLNIVQAFGDWQALLAFNGQATSDALIAGEQFGLGGADSVRGFLEREIGDDKGYFAKVEIYSPNMAEMLKLPTVRFRALAFFDMGAVQRNKALPDEPTDEKIASLGLGLRAELGKGAGLKLDVAQVQDAGGAQVKGDVRVHFALNYVF